jgi:chromosome segregation ATPase
MIVKVHGRNFMKRLGLFAVIVTLVLFLASAITSAQAPSSNDVNAALIRELHDLRLAIEKLANANSRVQLLSVRASQEGQLISTLTTDLISISGKFAEAQAETTMTNATLDRVSDRLRTVSDPRQRAELEEERNALALDLERKRIVQAPMQTQVEAIRQQIITEQRRLDDLERSIADLQK